MMKDLTKTIPQHVAIVMDGNGRWAQEQHWQRSIGHRAGVKSVEDIVRAAVDSSVKTLSLFAFSVENWGRPQDGGVYFIGVVIRRHRK